MRGQGFTSCLICKDDSGLKNSSEFLQKIIQTCYNTDEYNSMLSLTKVCFGCIGRFHQLYEFLQRKEDKKDTVIESDNTCRFCFKTREETALLDMEFQNEFRMMLEKTEMADDYPLSEHLTCCYSCSNFLQMWSQYKEILKECHDIFLHLIGNCRVVISNDPQVKQEQPDNTQVINETTIDSDTVSVILEEMPRLPTNLIEIPFTLPDELLQTPPSDAFNQSLQENTFDVVPNEPASVVVKDLSVCLHKLPSDNIISLKDNVFNNLKLRRGRSLSRVNQSQDINDNIVDNGSRRLRRETSVPSKFAEYEDSGKMHTPRPFRVPSLSPSSNKMTNNKRARRSTATPNRPAKKPRLNESQANDASLLALHNIFPCVVVIEPLAINPGKKSPSSSANKRVRKDGGPKFKITLPKKQKTPKKKDTPKRKKTRSTVFPLPLKCEPQDVDVNNLSNGMLKSTKNPDGLIITEDLPPSLVISEDFCEELFENLPQNGNISNMTEDSAPNAIDHEEVIDQMDVDDNSQYAHVSTEIEFLHPTHRERDTFQLIAKQSAALKEKDDEDPLLPRIETEDPIAIYEAALTGNNLSAGDELVTLVPPTGVAYFTEINVAVTAENLAMLQPSISDTNNNDEQKLSAI